MTDQKTDEAYREWVVRAEKAEARVRELEKQRLFPVQVSLSKIKRAHPLRIPWSIAEKAYSVYASRFGTSQSLERLAERGGFGACEMDEYYPDWIKESDRIKELEEKHRVVNNYRKIDYKKWQDKVKELEEKCKLYEKVMDINKFDKQGGRIKELEAETERLANEITDKHVPNQCHSEIVEELRKCDANIVRLKAEIRQFEYNIEKAIREIGGER